MERERSLFEKRDQENMRKLKALRQQKVQLIEQQTEKQSELSDAIESLQERARSLEGDLDHAVRVREELIRLTLGEVCDKEALKRWLTTEEQERLKL